MENGHLKAWRIFPPADVPALSLRSFATDMDLIKQHQDQRLTRCCAFSHHPAAGQLEGGVECVSWAACNGHTTDQNPKKNPIEGQSPSLNKACYSVFCELRVSWGFCTRNAKGGRTLQRRELWGPGQNRACVGCPARQQQCFAACRVIPVTDFLSCLRYTLAVASRRALSHLISKPCHEAKAGT